MVKRQCWNELQDVIQFMHLEQCKIDKTAPHNEQSSLFLKVVSKGNFTSFLACPTRFSFYCFTGIKKKGSKGLLRMEKRDSFHIAMSVKLHA